MNTVKPIGLALTLLLVLAGASQAFAQKSNKFARAIEGYYTALDAGDAEGLAVYLSPGAQLSIPLSPVPLDEAGIQQVTGAMKTAFPDMRHQVVESVAAGNTYAFKAVFTGTNTGSLMGNPPSNNRVELPFQGYAKFNKQGKIDNLTIHFDQLALQAQLSKGAPMSNKAQDLANRFFTATTTPNPPALLDQLLAADFKSHQFPGQGGSDKAGFSEGMKNLLTAFPDLRITVLQQYAQGDKVFTYAYWEATHRAPFMGIAATNKRVRVEFMDIWREANGQLSENWVQMDIAGLLAQLGAMPMAAK